MIILIMEYIVLMLSTYFVETKCCCVLCLAVTIQFHSNLLSFQFTSFSFIGPSLGLGEHVTVIHTDFNDMEGAKNQLM